MKQLLNSVVLFCTCQVGFCQFENCVELVKALLPNGVYEYENTNINEEMYHSVISFYKEHRQDTYSEIKKRSASLTVPIDDVLVGLNLSQDDNGYKQFIQNIETYYSNYSSLKTSIRNSWTHINVDAIDKLQPCFYVTPGIKALKVFTGDPNIIVVRFFYNNDYRNSPLAATIYVQAKSANIRVSATTVTVRHKNHNEITIRKIDSKFGFIEFKSNANTDPNSSLHFDFGNTNYEQAKKATNNIEILKGELKEASKLETTWGINDPDPDATIAQTYRPLNLGTNHYHEAAWASTNASANVLAIDKSFYSWQMEMTNTLGGKSGPNGTGGGGSVTPEYRTTINLPTSKNGNNVYYSITFKCGTRCVNCIGADQRHGIGKKGTVTITGANLDKSFSYTVTNDNEDFGSLTINNIKSGSYTLQLTMPTLLAGSSGEHFPAPPRNMVFQTKLSTNVTIKATK